MDILAGRKTVGSISGEILFGGVRPTKMFLRRYTGYVEQFDTLVPILTVEEMLLYTADLKLERTTPKEEKQDAVERVIDELGLETCRRVVIGDATQRGISGGQAKRVNIGIALISSPGVLFLDEPTTGLDSFTANEVMTVVKNLASGGVTVCATVHSPTSYCFSLFDRLLLLLGGQVAYFGRNDRSVIEYLRTAASSIATTVSLDSTSPAEWITDVTVVADRNGQAKMLVDAYASSPQKDHAEEELEEQLASTVDLPENVAKALAVKRETTTPMWYALGVLLRYRFVKNYTSVAFYASRAFPWILQTLILFSTFWAVGETVTPNSVPGIAGIIFFWNVAPAFSAASFVPAIVLSKPLFFRERNDGLYRPITFLMYLMCEEIVVMIPVTFIVSMAMWFGLRLAGSYILWWVSLAISFVVGVSSAYFIAALSPSIDVANAAVPIYGVLCMFFSGFLIRRASMGWWWRWYLYLVPNYYAVSAQLRNFFSGSRDIPFLGYPSVTAYYGVDYLTAWEFVGIHIIFPVVFTVLAWSALAFKTTIKR